MGFIKSFVTGDWDEWGEEELERINRRHEKERRRLERESEEAFAELQAALDNLIAEVEVNDKCEVDDEDDDDEEENDVKNEIKGIINE